MEKKVNHQAPDIVLNISDSPLSSGDIFKFFDDKPLPGLNRIYLIDGDNVLLKEF